MVVPSIAGDGASMEMAYRERWEGEIAEMRRVLAGCEMKEECKWGKPTYTVDGKNIVIMQGFKEYFGLGFFQGAILKDPKKLLVQLGQVHAGRVMKFTKREGNHGEGGDHQGLRTRGHRCREGWAADGAEEDLRASGSRGADGAVATGPRFRRAFEALTPGRQRSYLYHFAAAKQSATRLARIKKAMPAILEGVGFLERRERRPTKG
jgi:uncharacterized protein YdeI (YjbR/CyaY-like superfamily)